MRAHDAAWLHLCKVARDPVKSICAPLLRRFLALLGYEFPELDAVLWHSDVVNASADRADEHLVHGNWLCGVLCEVDALPEVVCGPGLLREVLALEVLVVEDVVEADGHVLGRFGHVDDCNGVGVVGKTDLPQLRVAVRLLLLPHARGGRALGVLRDVNDVLVLDDRPGLVGHLGEVVAEDERRLDHGPHGKVHQALVKAETAVAHFEHVEVVPCARIRLLAKTSCEIEDLGDAAVKALQITRRNVGAWAPIIVTVERGVDVTRDAPRVCDLLCEEPGPVLAPVAHGVEDGVALGLVERLGHGVVSIEGDLGRALLTLVEAVVVLEVLEAGVGPALSVDVLVAERADVVSAGHGACRRVDAGLEAEGLDLVDDGLEAVGELLRVGRDLLGVGIALVCLPAVVDDDVVVAELVEALALDGLGGGEDSVLADVAGEGVPCVPAHLRGEREAIVVCRGEAGECQRHEGSKGSGDHVAE
ncbi:hypothetical protein L1887_59838 [Cichorium endivia]|nr:hypothetical protein L1887_59838 [Cichorium endivia]